ncbi:bifunctional class I SAM-dependent methyltransferase/NUDIX hydrolase [Streptomyces endophytica]|uniref:NUDIX domain-containing protein n=1 Tax=Streptomyces endophytica TaxID=2991496 RepID=A0ABY6PFT9_9ACTN|nr:NUDIX domain-containing protein [Streptomyces endophytica]UZJ32730.1 NUDIX domain-containing protein [Streptomyces endophytica]
MGYTARDIGDAQDGYGKSFRPLGDAERALLHGLVPAPDGGGRALDVGCGPGELARHLAADGYEVDAVHHAPGTLPFAAAARPPAPAEAPAPAGVRFVRGDIENDVLDDLRAPYDLITLRLSLAFLRDRTRVLNRLRERLRPGGALAVIAPLADSVPDDRRELALDEAEIALLTAGWHTVERRDAEGLVVLVLRTPVSGPVPYGNKGRPSPHALTGAGVVVTDAAGRVLLGHSVRGGWELPGGKNDADESFTEAAVRELAEETGLRAEPGDARLLAILMDSTHGIPRLTAAVRVTAFTGEPAVREPQLIRRWEWHEVHDLPVLASGLFTPSAHVLDTVWPGILPDLPPVHRHPLV